MLNRTRRIWELICY